ncbi:MAG: helix-turn-helix domain-containing protein [Candidatus Gracilibacteria bacterium]
MIENFLTTEQVANILQVHPFTILKFIKQGKLRGVKLGRVYRIQESEVQRFLEERTSGRKEAAKPTPAREPEVHDYNISHSEKPQSEGDHYHII